TPHPVADHVEYLLHGTDSQSRAQARDLATFRGTGAAHEQHVADVFAGREVDLVHRRAEPRLSREGVCQDQRLLLLVEAHGPGTPRSTPTTMGRSASPFSNNSTTELPMCGPWRSTLLRARTAPLPD